MAKTNKKRRIFVLIALTAICAIVFLVIRSKNEKSQTQGPESVTIKRTTIVQKALAIGSIEPIDEIEIKSKISGVVGKLYADVGSYVRQGEPLLEVKPDPTPLELAEAKRDVEMKTIDLESLQREVSRQEQLQKRGLISDQSFERTNAQFEEAQVKHRIASERLDLLEKGKVRIADTDIETVVKAPISGFILERSVNVGDPVVPLTSYQAGTELMKMADMKNLVFEGTVDEIDVGKIQEGMPVDLQIGALPGKEIKGELSLISLKAHKEDNTTVFPVKIRITDAQGAVLRAGFSATANIIIAQKDSVLSLPERVVTFRNDSAFVRLLDDAGESTEQFIVTGLSDAIQIEICSGLQEGQKVLEKEVKEII
ncbi:efflux RND transporter periplasmic adaptor subunit [candidate division KSB1 bacterium]|nr:efflux RND transporter periplasmic adaptor subunit [candidate division KSB1 bacterium]